jgi:hypothetical protein
VDDWSFPWLTAILAAAVAVLLPSFSPSCRAAAGVSPGRVLRAE